MGAYGSYSNIKCHEGPAFVMEIGKASIWAGGQAEMKHDLDWDLRIRLLDSYSRGQGEYLVMADSRVRALLPASVTAPMYPPTLDVDWEDFGVPLLDKQWWTDLTQAIADMGEVNIGVYCHGGHGRTGTALSILAAISGVAPAEPIEWIRSHYCGEAVENWYQIQYVEDMTGMTITSKPTPKPVYGSVSGGKFVPFVPKGARMEFDMSSTAKHKSGILVPTYSQEPIVNRPSVLVDAEQE